MSMICFPLKDLTGNIRTETYRKSFLPSSTRLWNSLTPNLRDYTSHNAFKDALKRDLFPKPNRLFSYRSGEGLVNHAMLRMGLSALNQHTCKYNYIRDTAYPSCNHRHEYVVHFVLEYPTCQASRKNLMRLVSLCWRHPAGHASPTNTKSQRNTN